MTALSFAHVPETIVFAIDLAPELATEVGPGTTRLDILKHAINNFVLAKKRLSPNHRFGLVTIQGNDTELLQHSVTSSTEQFNNRLQQIQPASDAYSSSSSSSSSEQFDLGGLIAAVAPLVQQQQQQSPCGEIDFIHGGYLSVPRSNSKSDSYGGITAGYNSSNDPFGSSSSSTGLGGIPANKVRVILIYARSKLPAPTLVTTDQNDKNNNQGLAIDCLYLHDKPQPGINSPQEVYGALEDLVDQLSVKAGHNGFVYETAATRIGKLLSSMAMLLSHPSQRQAQSQTKAPIDLATAPLLPLPSDKANTLSGVPIMNPNQLGTGLHSTLPQGSAWARPLGVRSETAAAAAGDGSSSRYREGLGAWDQGGGPWLGQQQQQQQQDVTPYVPDIIDLWDNPAAAAAGGDVASAPQLPTVAVVSSSAAGSSGSSSSSSAHVVAGVPAEVVQGIPDRTPSFDDTAEGVALGVVVTKTNTPNDTATVAGAGPNSFAAAADPTGSSSTTGNAPMAAATAAAAAAGGTQVAGTRGDLDLDPANPFLVQRSNQGFVSQGMQNPGVGANVVDQNAQQGLHKPDKSGRGLAGLSHDKDVSADELEGLQAALMASAIEASYLQQQQQQRTQQ